MGADLVDRFGRTVRDLRVSLTDRCNLRCSYCMPAEGLPWLPRQDVLTGEEIVQVVDVAVQHGVREVRFTGGEPLLRPDVVDIVAQVVRLPGSPSTSITTNGIGLGTVASALADAGLARVNVSLDTLRPERFATLSRRDRLDDVLTGLQAARDAGLGPVKVNAVLVRGVNDDEALDLLAFCLERGYELRFIEQMPLDAQHGWRRDDMVTADEILSRLRTAHDVSVDPAHHRGSEPAERFLVDGGGPDGSWRVGVIASVTRPFCADCDRLRLTADGQLRNCLFARREADLRGVLRSGLPAVARRAQIAEVMLGEVARKAAGHGIDAPGFEQPDRPMSAIGG